MPPAGTSSPAPSTRRIRTPVIGSHLDTRTNVYEPIFGFHNAIRIPPFVALDVRSREVLALVGSYEAVRSGLDRATVTRRQPGSTFKPFVYGYAIHSHEMTPATIVETSPSALHGYRPIAIQALVEGLRVGYTDAPRPGNQVIAPSHTTGQRRENRLLGPHTQPPDPQS